MVEEIGDFWEHAPRYEALVCTINQMVKKNGELVMGKGIAKDFSLRYPLLAAGWGHQVANLGSEHEVNVLISPSISETNTGPVLRYLIGLQTKTDWRADSTYGLVERSLKRLLVEVDAYKISSVLMTRPGCGNGGLLWFSGVREMMLRLGFDNRFTVINE